MSIEKSFSRQIKRMERIPQRALYRQTRVIVKGIEKKTMSGLTKSPSRFNKKKLAKEVLWFFASALIAFLLAFLVFYISTHFFSSFVNLGIGVVGSVYNFFYVLLLVCFLGIYISRIVGWAIVHLTSSSN